MINHFTRKIIVIFVVSALLKTVYFDYFLCSREGADYSYKSFIKSLTRDLSVCYANETGFSVKTNTPDLSKENVKAMIASGSIMSCPLESNSLIFSKEEVSETVKGSNEDYVFGVKKNTKEIKRGTEAEQSTVVADNNNNEVEISIDVKDSGVTDTAVKGKIADSIKEVVLDNAIGAEHIGTIISAAMQNFSADLDGISDAVPVSNESAVSVVSKNDLDSSSSSTTGDSRENTANFASDNSSNDTVYDSEYNSTTNNTATIGTMSNVVNPDIDNIASADIEQSEDVLANDESDSETSATTATEKGSDDAGTVSTSEDTSKENSESVKDSGNTSVETVAEPALGEYVKIYVSCNNATGSEDGTYAHPFNTIQEAVDARRTGNETIYIMAGTYAEDIYVSPLYAGEQLAIQGEGKNLVIWTALNSSSFALSLDGVSSGSWYKISDLTFSCLGGGVSAANCEGTIRISDCNFVTGSTDTRGAIYVENSFNDPSSLFYIGNNEISVYSNAQIQINSSGFACHTSVRVYNNIFRVSLSSAIYAVDSQLAIYNDTFYNCPNALTAVNRSITSINPYVLFYDNIAGAVSGKEDNVICLENESGKPKMQVYIKYNDIYTQTSDDGVSGVYSSISKISDNINQNPAFVSDSDLHLSTSSPCINAGNPSSGCNDVDGTRNDMGAYGGPNAMQ